MVKAGISRVRIGEFAWSRIEPEPGRFEWGWLDRAIEVLHGAGLEIILGTPTATPPKWLVDRMADMAALGKDGLPRGFGSRRHYCFSHSGYREECRRITRAVADRYGRHPAIVMWQTDNEYGCHDTVLSYSDAARSAFARWLEERYGDIAKLNKAWGNVFWSMEYCDFTEIELPNLTVTEANPAHWLAFRRFSSDQVMAFNQAQVDILRECSPGRDVMHNAMGFFTDYDHHDLGDQLDLVTWDSYPLGFLETFGFSEDDKRDYVRQGHPDIAAFHHDLYRGCGKDGRWGVIEQQPGPVNWAPNNPAPLPGMVRLWTLEAMAHGAELLSFFRWRQAPFAQEQMHAGLLRPDSEAAPGLIEAEQVSPEIELIGEVGDPVKDAAIVFSFESEWVTATQPQGKGLSALWAAFNCYNAARELGLNVDIVRPGASLDGYKLVILPCLPIAGGHFAEQLAAFDGQIIIGPRSGSKTQDFSIPVNLPPGPLADIFPAKVARSESLRAGVEHRGRGWRITRWLDHLDTEAERELVADDGAVACCKHGKTRYCAAWPEGDLIDEIVARSVKDAGLPAAKLPEGLRVRKTGGYTFLFNYRAEECLTPNSIKGTRIIGGEVLPPAGVAVFRNA